MKVVDLCEFFSERGGGVRSYLTKMGAAAAALGHELVIVAPGPRAETQLLERGGRVERYFGPPMPYDSTYSAPLRVDRMRAIVKREAPDVLQVSSPFVPALVARSLRKGCLHTYVHHSDPIGCYLQPLVRRTLPPALAALALKPAWAWLRFVTSGVDATITAGEWLSAQLCAHACPRVHTVPFGIAHREFGKERRDHQLRQRLLGSLSEVPDARLLLVTGRLAVDKRQHLLVQAAIELARVRPIALVVLGDGPERLRLERLATALPQATFLSFLQRREEYAAMLASVDLLLHGSVCETFGFVIAETLASGTPVVVPDAGAAPHMVDPACAAIYEPDAGPQEIAAAAHALLDRDPSTLAAAAREAAARHPTMDEHFEHLFDLYQKLNSKSVL